MAEIDTLAKLALSITGNVKEITKSFEQLTGKVDSLSNSMEVKADYMIKSWKKLADSMSSSSKDMSGGASDSIKSIESFISTGQQISSLATTFLSLSDSLTPYISGLAESAAVESAAGVAAGAAVAPTMTLGAAFEFLSGPVGIALGIASLLIPIIIGIGSSSSDASGGIDTLSEAIDQNLKNIATWSDTYIKAVSNIADLNNVISDSGNTLSDIGGKTDELYKDIFSILSESESAKEGLREQDLANIEEYFNKVDTLQKDGLDAYVLNQQTTLQKASLDAGNLSEEMAASFLKEAQEGYDNTVEYAETSYSQKMLAITKALNQDISEEEKTRLETAAETARTLRDQQITDAERLRQDTLAEIQIGASDWIITEQEKFDTLNSLEDGYKEAYNAFWDDEEEGINSPNRPAKRAELNEAMLAAEEEYKNKSREFLIELSDANNEATANGISSWLNFQIETTANGGKIEGTAKSTAETLLSSFKGLPKDLEEDGKNTLLGLIAGMEGKIPGLEDASEMSADAIVKKIEDFLGIESPSKVMKGVGENITDGIKTGMDGRTDNLLEVARNTANSVLGAIKNVLGIKSPSSVFRDEVGKNIILGINEGFVKGLASTKSEMEQNLKSLVTEMSVPVISGMGFDRLNVNYGSIGLKNIESLNSNSAKNTYINYTFNSPSALSLRDIRQEMLLAEQRQKLMGA